MFGCLSDDGRQTAQHWTSWADYGSSRAKNWYGKAQWCSRADSKFAPSQWDTALFCNNVSHWMGTSQKSTLYTEWCNLLILRHSERNIVEIVLEKSFYSWYISVHRTFFIFVQFVVVKVFLCGSDALIQTSVIYFQILFYRSYSPFSEKLILRRLWYFCVNSIDFNIPNVIQFGSLCLCSANLCSAYTLGCKSDPVDDQMVCCFYASALNINEYWK